MSVALDAADEIPSDTDALVIGVFSDWSTTATPLTIAAEQLQRRGFNAKVGETLVLPGSAKRLQLLVGIGERRAPGFESFRRAGAALVGATKGCRAVAFDCRSIESRERNAAALAQAIGEGIL